MLRGCRLPRKQRIPDRARMALVRYVPTAIFNWWSVSRWRSTTKSSRTMGSDPRPLNDVTLAFSSNR